MIYGIGVDMIEVERVQQNISRDAGFKELVFSAGEIEYCESCANKYEHYAARFAAKEAFFKALGTGWSEGTHFKEVEIIHNGQGKPELVLTGATEQILSTLGKLTISVSLSHLKTIATAMVVIEQ
jgi:holo-[acyl-carrier protein] synthase